MNFLYRPGTVFISRHSRLVATLSSTRASLKDSAVSVTYFLTVFLSDPGIPESERKLQFEISEAELSQYWQKLETPSNG